MSGPQLVDITHLRVPKTGGNRWTVVYLLHQWALGQIKLQELADSYDRSISACAAPLEPHDRDDGRGRALIGHNLFHRAIILITLGEIARSYTSLLAQISRLTA